MTYDVDDIRAVVQKRKNAIFRAVFITVVALAVAIAVMIFSPDGIFAVVAVVAALIAISYLVRMLKKYPTKLIFSREIVGENVKEDEYLLGGTRVGRWSGYRFRYRRSAHFGDVYIKDENGNIQFIAGLPKTHIDVYEIGDTLLRYAGTKYPVVTSRRMDKQPCPICGTLNTCVAEACSSCGLKIDKTKA